MAQDQASSGDGRAEQVAAAVTRAVPNIIVKVLPDQSVCGPDEKTYGPGKTFEIEGPSAIALVQAGHVTIVGSVEEKEKK